MVRYDYQPKSAFAKWFHERLPIMELVQGQALDFPTPKNLNYFWTFGGILAVMLVAQIITGIVLAMHYTPHVDMAFDSIEHIRRDVNYGNIIQKLHANGASMFFLAVYIHIFRGMYYGSYKAPREVLWMIGVLILSRDDGNRFHGLRAALGPDELLGRQGHHQPVLGHSVLRRRRSRPGCGAAISVDNPTLNRFFSLHYLLPFVLAGLVGLHIWALHVPGNNNPTGVDVRSGAGHGAFPSLLHDEGRLRDRGVPDAVRGVRVLRARIISAIRSTIAKANPLVTPAHIVPEWYFLPFYAILRSIPDKLLGVIAMFGSILILFALPWLDTSRVRSGNLPAGLQAVLLDPGHRLHPARLLSGPNPPEGIMCSPSARHSPPPTTSSISW